MLQSVWNLSIKGACKEIRNLEGRTDSFSGIFSIKFDCATSHKDTCLLIDEFPTVDAPRKLEGSSVCYHGSSYKLLNEIEFNNYKKSSSHQINQKELFSICIDLLKKIKNVSCTDKFYQQANQTSMSSDKEVPYKNPCQQ
jgi:hypothetical protein